MPKFVFKLEALKRFRENRLLMARKDLVAIENNIHELAMAVRKAVEDRGLALSSTENTNDVSWMTLNSHLASAETRRIWILNRQIQLLEQDRERHARWVTHLGRELKAIEKLEEKKKDQFDAEQRLREKRSMDTWVAERWTFGAGKNVQETEAV